MNNFDTISYYVDINECFHHDVDQNSCETGAICVNTLGSFKCQCEPGYTRDTEKSNCEGTSMNFSDTLQMQTNYLSLSGANRK